MSTVVQSPNITTLLKKKPSAGQVIRTIGIVLLVIIVVAVIVYIGYSWYNSTNVSPININKKYYIIADDASILPFLPTYLNASKTSLYLSKLPETIWSFDPIGNGTTNITDNRGIMLKSSNGYMSDGSTSTPPTTSPTLMISDKGVAFTVSPFKDTTDTGNTNKLYKLTSDINILYNNSGIPELINLDNCNSSTCTTYWWRFAASL